MAALISNLANTPIVEMLDWELPKATRTKGFRTPRGEKWKVPFDYKGDPLLYEFGETTSEVSCIDFKNNYFFILKKGEDGKDKDEGPYHLNDENIVSIVDLAQEYSKFNFKPYYDEANPIRITYKPIKKENTPWPDRLYINEYRRKKFGLHFKLTSFFSGKQYTMMPKDFIDICQKGAIKTTMVKNVDCGFIEGKFVFVKRGITVGIKMI